MRQVRRTQPNLRGQGRDSRVLCLQGMRTQTGDALKKLRADFWIAARVVARR